MKEGKEERGKEGKEERGKEGKETEKKDVTRRREQRKVTIAKAHSPSSLKQATRDCYPSEFLAKLSFGFARHRLYHF